MRGKMLILSVVLVAAWLVVRPEMCSPTHPNADGLGTIFQARFYGGPPTPGELLALDGPIVDLCAYDRVYRADPLCIAARALFSIGGPGVIWLCPCSVGADVLNGRGPIRQFDGWYQLTCQEDT